MEDYIQALVVVGSITLSIGFLFLLINGSIYLMDKFQPERLERFKLEQYQQGVKDTAARIRVEK